MADFSDIDALSKHLRVRLQQPLPGVEAQARFSPRPPRRDPFARDVPADARPAAALILLYPHTHGLTIPLTVRRADLPQHAGQISLPGGRLDPGETPEAAALREAEEEVGVNPSTVTLLGALTPVYVAVSRFLVTPFVGIAHARPAFEIETREVSELLETPLNTLRDPSRLHWGHRTREGYLIDFPYFDLSERRADDPPHSGHQVWGATAMMLGEFVALFDHAFSPPPPPPPRR